MQDKRLTNAIIGKITKEQGEYFVERHQQEMKTQLAIIQQAMTGGRESPPGIFDAKESYFAKSPETKANAYTLTSNPRPPSVTRQVSHRQIVQIPSVADMVAVNLGHDQNTDSKGFESNKGPYLPEIRGIMAGENAMLNNALDLNFSHYVGKPIRHEEFEDKQVGVSHPTPSYQLASTQQKVSNVFYQGTTRPVHLDLNS